MIDPLNEFSWESLYRLYDKRCTKTGKFKPTAQALACFTERPDSDRALYYLLLDKVRDERQSLGHISLPTYEAIVYWKMYSTSPKISNDIERQADIREKLSKGLLQLSEFQEQVGKDVGIVLSTVTRMLALRLYGMKLPVCTTVLHFMYPESIPIFDQMILRAVGYSKEVIKEKKLNQCKELYAEYLNHHWSLIRKYSRYLAGFRESPTRVVEMALWVSRGE